MSGREFYKGVRGVRIKVPFVHARSWIFVHPDGAFLEAYGRGKGRWDCLPAR
jgi:hypothetical protein